MSELMQIDLENRRCSLQVEEGTSIDSIFGALDSAFDQLGLNKVVFEVASNEPIKIELARKLAFIEEGRLSRHVVRNDKPCDLILFSHFAETWSKRRKLLEPQLSLDSAQGGG